MRCGSEGLVVGGGGGAEGAVFQSVCEGSFYHANANEKNRVISEVAGLQGSVPR